MKYTETPCDLIWEPQQEQSVTADRRDWETDHLKNSEPLRMGAVGTIEDGYPHREVPHVLNHVRKCGLVAFLSPGNTFFIVFIEPIRILQSTTHAAAILTNYWENEEESGEKVYH
jgi:hypothetical protein